MIIANPIYDVVFKSLMEDLEIARGLIGGLIGRDVIHIETRANDTSLKVDDSAHSVTVYRMDYVAVIRLPDGGERRILVEVQKAKLGSEVRRFREYLGKQYMAPAFRPGPRGKPLPYDPPIVTIYILGFDLDEAIPPYAKVDRRIVDVLTGKESVCEEEFIEALTHDMFVLQTRRLSHKARTDLERLLAVFAQKDFAVAQSQHTIEVPDALTKAKNKLFQSILRHLKKLAADRETRKEMEQEDRSYAEFEYIMLKRQAELESKIDDALRQKEDALRKQEEERRQKEEERRQKEEERRQKEEERRQKEEERRQKESALAELAELKRQLARLKK